MLLTFLIIFVTIILFIWNRLRPDLVALLSLLALALTGVLTAQQALAGFADTTTIMVAALFVVGEGLTRTGVSAWLGQRLVRSAGSSELRLLVAILIGTAFISAFLSNTGTVAMLLPAVVAAAWRIKSIPSKFLIPLAFAANLGGMLTLIGTPPNLVISDGLVAAGYTGFGFFEFALLGLPLLVVAVLYIVTIGRRLLPAREAGTPPLAPSEWFSRISDSYGLQHRLFQLRVRGGSPLIGRTLADSDLNHEFGLLVLVVEAAESGDASRSRDHMSPALSSRLRAVLRQDPGAGSLPGPGTLLHPDDLLIVRAKPETVAEAAVALNLGVQEIEASGEELAGALLSPEAGMAEVLLTPRSVYAGSTIAESQFAQKFGVAVVTLLRGGQRMGRQETPLAFGDSLLVYGPWSNIARLRSESENFVVVGAPESMATQVVKPNVRTLLSVLILAVMVLLMLTKLVPTVIAVLLAAVAMVLVRCVNPDDAYRSINWGAVVLLAATLPMGTALQVTGGADLIANTLVNTLGQGSPYLLMGGIFLLTAGLSQVISNTATTVLLTPIVIATSQTLGIAPYAPMMMVAVGASAAFLTPIASPVNTLVFAPGGYRFGDYARVGLPLLFLMLVVSVVLAPLIWPLY